MTAAERIRELHPRRFFLETWARMDAEAAEARREREARGLGYDYRPLIVLCAGAALLTAMEYWGRPDTLARLVRAMAELQDPGEFFWSDLRRDPFYRLMEHGWWALARVLGFFVFPVVVIKLYGERVRDQGLSLRGFREHLWIYLLCFAVVFALVVVVSADPEFSSYYPFYRGSRRSWFDLFAWELMYAAQFFALEFFFRGWWLSACKTSMGSHAIFAMVVPYVMIHFGKPVLETLAAVIAGVVLGTLAMRTRSIWSGFLIHVSVALSMDVAALLRTGALPSTWWPVL